MIFIKFCFLLVFHLAHAWYEVHIDSILATVFNQDGKRDKVENDLMHKYQMPYRGAIMVFSVLWLWGVSLMSLFGIIFFSAYFWILFDIISNVTWLDKKWWFLGKTAKVDSLMSIGWNWAIKLLVLIGSAYAMYSIALGRDIIWEWIKSIF